MNYTPLYCSINPDGRLSLWDTQRGAMEGKEDGEMAFQITLTEEQLALVKDQQARSRRPSSIPAGRTNVPGKHRLAARK